MTGILTLVIRHSSFVILPHVAFPFPLCHIARWGKSSRVLPTKLAEMQIWPAIDLRGGKCVRLRQGDYGRETIYGDDPAAMAKKWVGEGATCLHLVDLD